MIESLWRSSYQKLLVDPLLKLPLAKKVSPQTVTALSLISGILAALLLSLHYKWAAVSALLLSGYCDTLDGSLARYQKKSSSLGAVFDIMSDRLVEFSIIFGFYLYAPPLRAIPTLLMLGSVLLCITSFLVVGIFSANLSDKSFHYSPGLIERAEAFLFWSVMIVWPSSFFFLSYTFAVLVFFTALSRLFQFSKQSCKP